MLIFVLALLAGCALLLVLIVFARIIQRKIAKLLRASSLPRSVTRSLNESRYYANMIVKMGALKMRFHLLK